MTLLLFLSRTRPGITTAAAFGSNQYLFSKCRPCRSTTARFLSADKKSNRKKFTVNQNITQANVDKLARAFDELARKEGFDDTTAFYAPNDTFEDEFDDDDYDYDENDEKLDASEFRVRDFKDMDETEDVFDDINFDDDDDMDARIAAAMRDNELGRVSVPSQMEEYATSYPNLKKLGFRREKDPFQLDETPRREQFKIVTDAMVCSACGADFQSQNEQRPGYLPPEKFDIQVKLSKIEQMQKLQEKAADDAEWSTDDEIDWLIQTSGKSDDVSLDKGVAEIDIDAMAEEMGLDLLELSSKKVICKRCHGLQNFGKVDDTLRPGWTKEPSLSQEKFKSLLKPIREKPAVIIALVDLFDFSGSVLAELDNIAGDNPVILAANKVDLLPSAMGKVRVESWVRRELEYLGVKSLANTGGAVRLISCKTGDGVAAMLDKARQLAEEVDGDIYVVGAANAGKSTLLNRIPYIRNEKESDFRKKRAGNRNAKKGAVTTSPLPGTTLKFIKVDLGDGRALYDTPGLLVPGTLTQLLTPDELKMVVPKKKVEPITFRVASGKCVLIGGLARIEVIGDCKPFLLTFFVSNDIKLHPTDSSKVDEFVMKHTGELLTPPLPPGPDRLQDIGDLEEHVVEIEGTTWKEAAADISLTGLGWVAVTGPGRATLRISLPKGIGIAVRPPLMPFDIWEATASYTGGKPIRKVGKRASGNRRKGVGRR